MGPAQTIAELPATVCCSLFAGAAVYITLVEYPARMECGGEVAATEFPPSYRRGAMMQAPLAILGFVLSFARLVPGSEPLVGSRRGAPRGGRSLHIDRHHAGEQEAA